jgi:hypothetical protein
VSPDIPDVNMDLIVVKCNENGETIDSHEMANPYGVRECREGVVERHSRKQEPIDLYALV